MDSELDNYGKKAGGGFNIADLESELNNLGDDDDDSVLDKMAGHKPASKAQDISELENMIGLSDEEEQGKEEEKKSNEPKIDKSSTRSNPTKGTEEKSDYIPPKKFPSELPPQRNLKDELKFEMMIMNIGFENSLMVIASEVNYCKKRMDDKLTPDPIKKFYNDTMEGMIVKKKKILILIAKGQLPLRIYSQSIMDSIKYYCKVLKDLKEAGANSYMQRVLGKVELYKKENEALVSGGDGAFQTIVSKIDPNIKIPPEVERARASKPSKEPQSERRQKKFHMIPMPQKSNGKYEPTGYIYIPDLDKCPQEMLVDVFNIRYKQYKNLGKYLMANVKDLFLL